MRADRAIILAVLAWRWREGRALSLRRIMDKVESVPPYRQPATPGSSLRMC